jgi:hypothetical protein
MAWLNKLTAWYYVSYWPKPKVASGPEPTLRSCMAVTVERLSAINFFRYPNESLAYQICLPGLSAGFQTSRRRNAENVPTMLWHDHRTGSDFRPPSADDEKGWAVASFLISNGFPYYRLGVQYPATLKEAHRFVEENASEAIDMSTNRAIPQHWPRDHRA